MLLHDFPLPPEISLLLKAGFVEEIPNSRARKFRRYFKLKNIDAYYVLSGIEMRDIRSPPRFKSITLHLTDRHLNLINLSEIMDQIPEDIMEIIVANIGLYFEV